VKNKRSEIVMKNFNHKIYNRVKVKKVNKNLSESKRLITLQANNYIVNKNMKNLLEENDYYHDLYKSNKNL